MKKRITGWILLVWGSLGLLANLIIWLPYLDGADVGYFIINSCVGVVFIVVGIMLIKMGKGNIKKLDEVNHA